jgi:hypothetical protein
MCFVKDFQEVITIDNMDLDDFLSQHGNQQRHEFIRQSILSHTLTFNNRIKKIYQENNDVL